MLHASSSWLSQVTHALSNGAEARDTLELTASQVRWDMNHPLVVIPERKVNYKFACAEAAYIISGQNRIEFLTENAMKGFADYSDDGVFQNSSYGPPFVDQLPYILDVMKSDISTRQAVISIWRPKPRASKDIACTLTLQFLVRDDQLHTIVNMRSSDIWKGLIYDMFCFSIMSSVVAHYVGIRQLGAGYIHAGSSHLYTRDKDAAISVVRNAEQFVQGPKIGVADIEETFHWLMKCCDLGDRDDCLIGLYGGLE